MSSGGIFIIGTLVTLIVAGAIVPLFWAAVLDGREQERFEAQQAAGRER